MSKTEEFKAALEQLRQGPDPVLAQQAEALAFAFNLVSRRLSWEALAMMEQYLASAKVYLEE